ncbi:hypothetical protein [uncultured Eubacterium sp.]|uniref:hypothetical protein n=1 Tax=uncultured Eubacterium sp. TaxID=165185 RepID=UPI0025913F11|nr:hypothetical protein [uncultured Eubacterium sp.]
MWITIIQISKKEAMILNKDYRIPYKREGGISHSSPRKYKKNRKYYLCERDYNLDMLKKIRSM